MKIDDKIIIDEKCYVISKPLEEDNLCSGCMLDGKCNKIPLELKGCVDEQHHDIVFIEENEEKEVLINFYQSKINDLENEIQFYKNKIKEIT